MKKYIGYLRLEPPYMLFSVSELNLNLKFRVASKIRKILRIKEQDRGYLVIDADYEGLGVLEDYVDLRSVLYDLDIPLKDTIDLVKEVKLK